MRALARGGLPGVAVEGLAPGLRRLLAGRHVIFFRIEGERLQGLRIFDQSQDPGRHLLP